MHGVEDDHALRDLGRVLAEVPGPAVAAPDAERRRAHLLASMMRFSSGGISGIGWRATVISPPRAFRMTRFSRPQLSTFAGQSSRKCAPRLSFRSRPARVTASDTVSRLARSSAVCQPLLYSRLPV